MKFTPIKCRKGKKLMFNQELANRLNDDVRFRTAFILWRENHSNPGISGVDPEDPSGERKVTLADVCHVTHPLRGLVNHWIREYDDAKRYAELTQEYPELRKANTAHAPTFSVVMSTQVPNTIADWVDTECQRTGLTKSDVIRAALVQCSGLSDGETKELENLDPAPITGTGRKIPVTLSLSGPLIEAIEHVGGSRNRSATVERLLRDVFNAGGEDTPEKMLTEAKKLITSALKRMK